MPAPGQSCSKLSSLCSWNHAATRIGPSPRWATHPTTLRVHPKRLKHPKGISGPRSQHGQPHRP
eukprot:1339513-Prorocentrum_lima.AAC.1